MASEQICLSCTKDECINCLDKSKTTQQTYRERHREEERRRNKTYREDNKEKERERHKKYRQKIKKDSVNKGAQV